METRRVAMVGRNRIPCAASGGAYARASNEDMFTVAILATLFAGNASGRGPIPVCAAGGQGL